MKKNTYCVYGHRNKINNKWYIGQTVHGDNPEKRWGVNGSRYKTQTPFANAIIKYGWDNFEHKILKENLTKEEADHWEKHYIEYYDSKTDGNGYNCTDGGEGIENPSEETRKKISESRKGEKHPFYGKHRTEETKQKLSEANKGKRQSEETKQKISESLKGEKHYNYGKHLPEETKQKISEAKKGEKSPNYGKLLPEETKQKMSESQKGKHAGEKNPCAKKVICIETNEIFTYAKECAEKMKIGYDNLKRCCQGRQKTACGYHFKYYED